MTSSVLAACSAMAVAVALASPALAQFGSSPTLDPQKLVQVSVAPVALRAGETARVSVVLTIAGGWHVNGNPPSPEYMIPTTIEISADEGLKAGAPVYPLPKALKVTFEDTELSVYDERAQIEAPITASPRATNGTHRLRGKLTFQACNDQVCLAPATMGFSVSATVTGGSNASTETTPDAPAGDGVRAPPQGALQGTSPDGDSASTPSPGATGAPSSGFATAPPAGGSRSPALDNPIARQLERGGFLAFFTLFLIGLALNLTPCVYPMLGVTVSIFGARRAAPLGQVVGLALLYVLGMAAMYSTLGLVAALTGGLFGGFLQNPIVLVGIGLLLVALSLSMFGLYEFELPASLRARLGGTSTTSAASVFASGLMVGVFAAPCIGPPVVALLALVGAKGDPWFGFTSFFVLALGLGAPYLVLATFSNLIQTLPRSGGWMVWVKKVFGVVLLALGAFYALLGLAPDLTAWVAPAALILGGIYLGFIEGSVAKKPGFVWLKRVTGAVALACGVVIVATTPREVLAFREFSPQELDASLKNGKPVMLDFTANWCAPCHELERFTFTDRRVIEAAKTFTTLKVDLTRYDSPESERWRRQYQIRGVPTVLFVHPNGVEILGARVEGFLPPEHFLERMRLAAVNSVQAARE